MKAENENNRWPEYELGQICDVQLGKMLSPKSKQGLRPIPYLRNQNVQWNRVDVSDVSWMDFSAEEEKKFRLQEGDLLVCEGGEPGRAAVWQGQIERCCYQKALHRIRARTREVDPYYLMFRLWLSCLDNEFAGSESKTTIAHLPRERLIRLRIPVPPLETQQSIATRLKASLKISEQSRNAAQARLAAAEALPAAYLREIFEGPEASEWETAAIGDLCDLLPSKSIATAGDAEVLAVTTASLSERGFLAEGVKTARMMADDVPECLLSKGEILIARSNTAELVGRVSMYPGVPERIVASDLTIRLWPRDGAIPEFMTAYLSYLYLSGYWREKAGGASGSMKKITREQIKAQTLPWPGRDEQLRIVAVLSGKQALSSNMIARCREELAAIEALPAAMLRQAFESRN